MALARIEVLGDAKIIKGTELALGDLLVTGTVVDLVLTTASMIKSLTAAVLDAVTIFAGVNTTHPADRLPDSLDDFVRQASIKKVTVKGVKGSTTPSYLNSLIAAFEIGTVKLKEVDLDNMALIHGVAGNMIKTLAFIGSVAVTSGPSQTQVRLWRELNRAPAWAASARATRR